MVIKVRLYKTLALLFLAFAGPATAADPAPPPLQEQHFIGRYYVTWSGLNLAAIELAIDKTRDDYTVRLAARSAGLVNLFTRHRSDTSAHGRRDGDHYYPESYESHYWTKNKPRHIKITFDAKGVVTEELVEPPEDRKERPEVPHNLKDGALDPLTLILVLATAELKPHVFDAKHLYEGKLEREADAMIRTYTGPRVAIKLLGSRIPIAGMTQKEMKEYAEGEPSLTLYLSADGTGIPLYLTMPVSVGLLKGSLVQECKTWDECKIE